MASKAVLSGVFGTLRKLQGVNNIKSIVKQGDKKLLTLTSFNHIQRNQERNYVSRSYTTKKLPIQKKPEYYLSSDSDEDAKSDPKKGLRGLSDFWRRKMRTIHNLLDFNKDSVISYEDFQLFVDNFINLGHISEKSAKEFRGLIKRTWEAQWGEISPYNIVTVERYLEDMQHVVNDPSRIKKVDAFLPYLFEAIDRDKSGKITLKEFKLFFECLGHEDEDAVFTFRIIDTNADGSVDKHEFLKYGKDFFISEDETRISKYFWGPLLE
ncbi:sarcoplasmic calcium-binding protein [Onthophagus taurus]|uniref:sarcoplasmic calcium-binding protein n=1 Tax=Onthophagus taurus TaxID=166361 RepID=UPI0039BEC41C